MPDGFGGLGDTDFRSILPLNHFLATEQKHFLYDVGYKWTRKSSVGD